MDRKEESVCCQVIPACVSINQESPEIEGIAIPECITDKPVFQNLGLNIWVLQLTWSHFWQQYGTKSFEGPEHKKNPHFANRTFVGCCWDILGKEVGVPLPSCVVSCIRAHFPPPGLEEDFLYKRLKFANK